MSDILQNMRRKARDNGRTPMQWNGDTHAGFTTAERPWMKIHDDYRVWNAETQQRDPDSIWSFWKMLIELRKEHLVLVYGDFQHVAFEHEDVFVSCLSCRLLQLNPFPMFPSLFPNAPTFDHDC